MSSQPRRHDSFRQSADQWWDRRGAFAPLHRINPVRLGYIIDHIERFHPQPGPPPWQHVDILDIGCGGGLCAEPLARLGANVCGIDPSPEAIDVAKAHAKANRLRIDYRRGTIDHIGSARFDVVLALEVIEHSDHAQAFLERAAAAVKPGGLLFLSTLNRTFASWLFAIAGAEYLLGWIEKGTHDWRRFIPPDHMADRLHHAGLVVRDVSGIVPRLAGRGWRIDPNRTNVNYILCADQPIRKKPPLI